MRGRWPALLLGLMACLGTFYLGLGVGLQYDATLGSVLMVLSLLGLLAVLLAFGAGPLLWRIVRQSVSLAILAVGLAIVGVHALYRRCRRRRERTSP